MIGLNDKLLQQYVEWIANKRLKSIGLNPVYDIPLRNNPLPWTQHWISSKGLQVAPQETEVESYIVGGIKQDVKKDTFSGFKLQFVVKQRKEMRLDPPFPKYPEYMNGRLKKIDMTARLNDIKNGLANNSWYPEWDDRQRGAAQRILNNALDVLDEYDY